jgi:glycerophosphoryl diester phosphodiesterase
LSLSKQPLIIGHRGASTVAPENTLAAFQWAIDCGADGIEFDVRLSADGVPVVIHDANLKRTALVDSVVSKLTVRELQRVDVGAFFKPAHAGSEIHPVPTLTQVFGMFRHEGGLLYLELKGEPVTETLITRTAELVTEAGIQGRVIVESFDLQAIKSLKRVAPHIPTAALFERRLRRPGNLFNKKILTAATDSGADELALHYTLVSDRLVNAAKAAGFKIVVWTVDDPKWVGRARDLGIKSLITNDPASMLANRA